MRDSLEWRAAAEEALTRERVAVATVVDVRGSAFRHEGARIFIWAEDRWEGNISGGCLEPDVAQLSQAFFAIAPGAEAAGDAPTDAAAPGAAPGESAATAAPRGVSAGAAAPYGSGARGETRRYDLAEEDMWGLGLGCGGEVEVLVEPLPAALYRRMLLAPRGGVAVRPIPAEPGPLPPPHERGPDWWWDAEHGSLSLAAAEAPRQGAPGSLLPASQAGWLHAAEAAPGAAAAGPAGEHGGPSLRPPGGATTALLAELARRAAARWASGESGSETVPDGTGATRRYFFDVVRPARQLVVCGAGHDSAPLVDLAARAGFRVAVVDPRPAFLTAERFPRAARLILAEPAEGLADLDLLPGDAIVVKNHHRARDRAALRAALATDAGYVGQLGPRSRTREMLEGEWPDRLHAPVGLDLGGETPEQVAVSIVAELLAWANGRGGGPLREADGPIHGTRHGAGGAATGGDAGNAPAGHTGAGGGAAGVGEQGVSDARNGETGAGGGATRGQAV